MDARLEALKGEILRERRFGKTTLAVQKLSSPVEEPAPLLDAFAVSLGFRGIGDDWKSITEPQARTLLRRILSSDLAYDCEIMSTEAADALAARFLDTFSTDRRCFTNGNLYERRNGASWTPLSDATFDTGVACADAHSIGIIWVEDED